MSDPRGEELGEQLDRLEALATRFLADKPANSNNVNTVRIEGAGSIWNGLALGVVFGATIMAGAWMVSSQQDMRESIRQAETYRAAVYMVAPRLSEAIDQELDKRNNRYEPHPDSDPAAEERAEAGGSKGPGEAAGP